MYYYKNTPFLLFVTIFLFIYVAIKKKLIWVPWIFFRSFYSLCISLTIYKFSGKSNYFYCFVLIHLKGILRVLLLIVWGWSKRGHILKSEFYLNVIHLFVNKIVIHSVFLLKILISTHYIYLITLTAYQN